MRYWQQHKAARKYMRILPRKILPRVSFTSVPRSLFGPGPQGNREYETRLLVAGNLERRFFLLLVSSLLKSNSAQGKPLSFCGTS